MKLPTLPSTERLLVVLSFLGLGLFYLWTPISELFLTDNFVETMSLHLEGEQHHIDKDRQLLVIHVKSINKGTVPITIGKDKKNTFTLEIRKIENPSTPSWLNYDKMEKVNQLDLLKNLKDGYVIESNNFYDDVEGIPLSNGFYWVKTKLTFENGDFLDDSVVVNLTDDEESK